MGRGRPRLVPADDWLLVSYAAEFGIDTTAAAFGMAESTLKNYLHRDLYPRLRARGLAHAVLLLSEENNASRATDPPYPIAGKEAMAAETSRR